MKIKSVELRPLADKHYETEIRVVLQGDYSEEYIGISIYGSTQTPSEREIKRGWEPDWGRDHVESKEGYEIAKLIMEMLSKNA